MKTKLQSLSTIWNSYPQLYNDKSTFCKQFEIQSFITDLLRLGPFYASVIDMNTCQVHQIFNSAKKVHGLVHAPSTYWDLIDLIHHEDIDHVLCAEKAKFHFMKNIPRNELGNYKYNYSFRMKVNGGSYHLFHHQSINLSYDHQNNLTKSLIINTDINHLTTHRNNQLQVEHIHANKLITKIPLDQEEKIINQQLFSKRELEVLVQMAQGFPSRIIAENLFISEATVRVHRKNLLKKSQTHNSNILIKQCIEAGLI